MRTTSRRRRVDPAALEAFIRDSGISYKLSSKSFVFTCPKCKKRDKLWLYRDGSCFSCFVCSESEGFRGAPEIALKELTGRSLSDVRRALYGADAPSAGEGLFIGINTEPEIEDVPELDLGMEGAPDLAWPLDYYPLIHRLGQPGAEYLERRGIPRDIAAEYDIRYYPRHKTICFPVYVDERLVGWQARITSPETYTVETEEGIITKKRLKIVSTPGIPRDRVVMFQNRLKGSESCVLCEGPVDALKAHFIGGNVATMGKAIGDKQVYLLHSHGIKRVYVALDPDAASELNPLVEKLHRYNIETFHVEVPSPYKDLGEMPLDLATTTILSAPPLNPGGLRFYIDFKSVSR